MKKYFVFGLIIIFMFSCTKKEDIKKIGEMKVLNKTKMEKENDYISLLEIGDNFLGFGMNNKMINIFNKEGEIIFTYKKIGKGPGEYTDNNNLQILGKLNNKLYTLCGDLQKIMIFDIIDNKKLEYIDEYYMNDGQVGNGNIRNGKIYLSTLIADKQVLEYNSICELSNSYISKEKKSFRNMNANEIKKFLVNSVYIPYFRGDRIILLGVLNNRLKIYERKDKKYSLISDKKIVLLNKDMYKSETRENKNRKSISIQTKGYIGSKVKNDRILIAFCPEGSKKSYVVSYDYEGNYLGSYILEDSEEYNIGFCYFVENSNEFYFVKSYKKDDNDNFEEDNSILYRAKLVKN